MRPSASPLLVAGLLSVALAGLAGGQKGPLLRLSTREIDFGRVDQHQQVKDEVIMRNEGDAPLKILKITPDCGCAAGTPTDSTILPGREATLGVAFSTRNYKGPQNKKITLETNDPAEPTVVIRLLADVRPFVRLSEERVDFETVARGDAPTRRVVVSADEGLGFEIVGVEGVDAIFETSVEPVSSPGEDAYAVTLKLRPDAPPGAFRARARIRVKGPPVEYVDLLAAGTVTSYFVVEGGNRLRFPAVDAGSKESTSVRITSDGSQPFRLLKVESSAPYLTGDIAPDGDGAYQLTITLQPTAPSGHFRETVTVKTTDPDQDTISIEVLGRVRT